MQYFHAQPVQNFKDKDGNVPEILMVDGNRTGGKTTAFSKMMVEEFLQQHKKFMLLYRWKSDLNTVSDAFFKDIKGLFFPEYEMTHQKMADGRYYELYLNNVPCGYAVALSMSAKIKKFSHIFNDVENMFFDEYQDEQGEYLTDEVSRLMSIHTTVSRGRGQAVRFVPVYMCSNSITIFNPYYEALGISTAINDNTKVYRGEGFVLIRVTIKDVMAAQRASGFNRAFAGSSYSKSAIDNAFMNDDKFNVVKRDTAAFRPLYVLKNKGELFTVFLTADGFHVRRGADTSFSLKFGVQESDKTDGFANLRNTSYFTKTRFFYSEGKITFEDILSKNAIREALSVSTLT